MASCDVGQLLDTMKCLLNDPDEEHWDKDELFKYMCLAIADIFNSDKDGFSELTEVTLKPGCVQNFCELGCDNFSGFIRIKGAGRECEVPDEASNSTQKLNKYFAGICAPKAKEDEDYTLESFETSEDDPCSIVVNPPVPEGERVVAIIGCSKIPEVDIDGTLPPRLCEKINMILQLTLHYAYSKDNQVNVNFERANTHFRNYLALMDRELRAEEIDRNTGSDSE